MKKHLKRQQKVGEKKNNKNKGRLMGQGSSILLRSRRTLKTSSK